MISKPRRTSSDLARFVPDILILSVKNICVEHRFIQQSSSFYDGSCLIVDISGFTRIAGFVFILRQLIFTMIYLPLNLKKIFLGNYCRKGKPGLDMFQECIHEFLG
jgi:hypothetical protein